MTFRTLLAAAALVASAPLAFAQTAVAPGGAVPVSPEPGVITGASGGTPAGTGASSGGAIPRSAETPGNSGALGGQTAEQHEKFGN